jgi:RNA polymerase sigma factor (TIGR02999 family)
VRVVSPLILIVSRLGLPALPGPRLAAGVRYGLSMAADESADVTELLLAWRDGNQAALEALVPLVHAELVSRARRYMARERPGHPLQSHALVNEAYMRMIDVRRVAWQNRAHFFAVAATLMRRILVDVARAERGAKRGGGAPRLSLEDAEHAVAAPAYDVLGVHEALDSLARLDPRRAQVVELRIFGGLTIEETAAVVGVSTDTVKRDWALAKAWLARELANGEAIGGR